MGKKCKTDQLIYKTHSLEYRPSENQQVLQSYLQGASNVFMEDT